MSKKRRNNCTSASVPPGQSVEKPANPTPEEVARLLERHTYIVRDLVDYHQYVSPEDHPDPRIRTFWQATDPNRLSRVTEITWGIPGPQQIDLARVNALLRERFGGNGFAELRAAIDCVMSHCEITYQAVLQLTLRQLAEALESPVRKETTDTPTDRQGERLPALDTEGEQVLKVLATSPRTRFSIRAISTALKRKVSEKTIGLRLNSLVGAGLVERDQGKKSGAAVTVAGSSFFHEITSQIATT